MASKKRQTKNRLSNLTHENIMKRLAVLKEKNEKILKDISEKSTSPNN